MSELIKSDQEIIKSQRDNIVVHVTICRDDVKLPFYANPGDAGMDIVAAQETIIPPGETRLIPTGIKVAIPEGYEIQVRPRSGLSLNTPLRVPNSPGTIDCGFRDEIKVLMENKGNPDCLKSEPGNKTLVEPFSISTKGNLNGVYKICKGERIASINLKKFPAI